MILWDPTGAIASSQRSLLVRYFSDVARDSGTNGSVFSVARQYADSTGFAAYQQTFVAGTQTIIDSTPYPSSGGCHSGAPGATACLTDAQVGSELTRLIAARGLPTGLGSPAPVYFVVLPDYVDECVYGSDCSSRSYCGYHTYMTAGGGATVLYAVVPMISLLPAEDPKACQWDGHSAKQEPNQNIADLLLPTFSHEYNEITTDPLLNAWYTTGVAEIGDLCSNTGPYDPLGSYNPNAFLPVLGGSASGQNLYNQRVNGDRYYVQSEWSNGAQGCAMWPTKSSLVARFRVLGPKSSPGSTVAFDPSASLSSTGFSSATWDFGDGTRQFFVGAPPQVSHTFPSSGSYTVSLTVVDRLGNLQTARTLVVVRATPGGPGARGCSQGCLSQGR